MGHMIRKQGAEVTEDLGIFRPGKSVNFGFMHAGPPKRLYPGFILHPLIFHENYFILRLS